MADREECLSHSLVYRIAVTVHAEPLRKPPGQFPLRGKTTLDQLEIGVSGRLRVEKAILLSNEPIGVGLFARRHVAIEDL
jgi:hypothetical protein